MSARPKHAPPKDTAKQFKAVLDAFAEEDDGYDSAGARQARHALYAAMWFLENVAEDDPARTDLFFEVRALSRAVW